MCYAGHPFENVYDRGERLADKRRGRPSTEDREGRRRADDIRHSLNFRHNKDRLPIPQCYGGWFVFSTYLPSFNAHTDHWYKKITHDQLVSLILNMSCNVSEAQGNKARVELLAYKTDEKIEVVAARIKQGSSLKDFPIMKLLKTIYPDIREFLGDFLLHQTYAKAVPSIDEEGLTTSNWDFHKGKWSKRNQVMFSFLHPYDWRCEREDMSD